MVDRERVVAVGLLTEHDLSLLGRTFSRAYRLPEDETFRDLLIELDKVDMQSFHLVRASRSDR